MQGCEKTVIKKPSLVGFTGFWGFWLNPSFVRRSNLTDSQVSMGFQLLE